MKKITVKPKIWTFYSWLKTKNLVFFEAIFKPYTRDNGHVIDKLLNDE